MLSAYRLRLGEGAGVRRAAAGACRSPGAATLPAGGAVVANTGGAPVGLAIARFAPPDRSRRLGTLPPRTSGRIAIPRDAVRRAVAADRGRPLDPPGLPRLSRHMEHGAAPAATPQARGCAHARPSPRPTATLPASTPTAAAGRRSRSPAASSTGRRRRHHAGFGEAFCGVWRGDDPLTPIDRFAIGPAGMLAANLELRRLELIPMLTERRLPGPRLTARADDVTLLLAEERVGEGFQVHAGVERDGVVRARLRRRPDPRAAGHRAGLGLARRRARAGARGLGPGRLVRGPRGRPAARCSTPSPGRSSPACQPLRRLV